MASHSDGHNWEEIIISFFFFFVLFFYTAHLLCNFIVSYFFGVFVLYSSLENQLP